MVSPLPTMASPLPTMASPLPTMASPLPTMASPLPTMVSPLPRPGEVARLPRAGAGRVRARRLAGAAATDEWGSQRSSKRKDPDGLLCVCRTEIQTVYFAFAEIQTVQRSRRSTLRLKTPRKLQTVYQRKLQTRHSMPLTSPSAHSPQVASKMRPDPFSRGSSGLRPPSPALGRRDRVVSPLSRIVSPFPTMGSPLPGPGEVARVPRAGAERVRARCLAGGVAPSSGLRPPSPALGRRDRTKIQKTPDGLSKKAPDPPLDAPHITFCAFAVSRLEKET